MKVVLFDLGDTLETNDVLLPGAIQTLTAIRQLATQHPLAMGLVSDFEMPSTPADIAPIRQQYLNILDNLHIRSFFEPAAQRVTLSTEVGVLKPAREIFRAAVDKFQQGLPFESSMFVTENRAHVLAARRLGIRGVHLNAGSNHGADIRNLTELVPLVREFVGASERLATSVWRWSPDITPLEESTHWSRFGDDLFVFEPASISAAGMRGTGTPPSTPEVRRGDLHVVVQRGRSFQKANPGVRVLLDRGRFLVVALPPERAAELQDYEHRHFAVRPLSHRHVAFNTLPIGTGRVAQVPWIKTLVDGISRAPYEADLTRFTSFHTRHSTSTQYVEAASWAADQLTQAGFQVQTQEIHINRGVSRNVIADRLGRKPGNRAVVIATAHLDSVNHDAGGGPLARAPGADDNGSGSAGILQIARSFRDHPNSEDLRLILFGGEEQGLFGSSQYVPSLSRTERRRIRAIVNMDMIGRLNRPPLSVLLEGAPVSRAIIDGLAQSAATYTNLVVETSLNPFDSDHVPFIDAGLPAVLTIEGADQTNEDEHTERDVISKISFDMSLEILRLNVAFIASQIGRVE